MLHTKAPTLQLENSISNLSFAMTLETRSDVVPIEPDVVPHVVEVVTTRMYFQVITLTVLVFDSSRYFDTPSHLLETLTFDLVITFDREVMIMLPC